MKSDVTFRHLDSKRLDVSKYQAGYHAGSLLTDLLLREI